MIFGDLIRQVYSDTRGDRRKLHYWMMLRTCHDNSDATNIMRRIRNLLKKRGDMTTGLSDDEVLVKYPDWTSLDPVTSWQEFKSQYVGSEDDAAMEFDLYVDETKRPWEKYAAISGNTDECFICMEQCDDKSMYAFQCTHTMCSSCIGHMKNKDANTNVIDMTSLTCPFCRSEVKKYQFGLSFNPGRPAYDVKQAYISRGSLVWYYGGIEEVGSDRAGTLGTVMSVSGNFVHIKSALSGFTRIIPSYRMFDVRLFGITKPRSQIVEHERVVRNIGNAIPTTNISLDEYIKVEAYIVGNVKGLEKQIHLTILDRLAERQHYLREYLKIQGEDCEQLARQLDEYITKAPPNPYVDIQLERAPHPAVLAKQIVASFRDELVLRNLPTDVMPHKLTSNAGVTNFNCISNIDLIIAYKTRGYTLRDDECTRAIFAANSK